LALRYIEVPLENGHFPEMDILKIFTSWIDPLVLMNLYTITIGIEESDDRVISQPIACPQAG